MQLTFDSDEPIEKVLAVVSAVYGVEVVEKSAPRESDGDQGITRPRPT